MINGKRLRELRKRHKLTGQELGDIIGVTGQQVTRYETGKSDMTTSTLKQLATVFKVSTDYLLAYEVELTAMSEPLLGPHTLKDDYHEALEKGLKRLQITQEVKDRIELMKEAAPAAYIGLAALAHEHGHAALYLGIRVAFPYGDSTPYDDMPQEAKTRY